MNQIIRPVKRGISSGDVRWTLEDFIMDLFDRNETASQEFQSMRKFYGEKKIADIYEKYVHLKGSVK